MKKTPGLTSTSCPQPTSEDEERRVSTVLVVDDFEPFRRFICSTLEKRPGLKIVGEASDGLEAVHKAEELQPDLIVLDIGLPTLNGIEAARRILEFCPECKIIFLSQESSADVVEEALGLGAWGYVVKAHAGSELLPAAEAVCRGMQFVSRGISGYDHTPGADLRKESSLSLATEPPQIDRSHTVEFFPDDASFVVGFSRFVEAALNSRNAVIVVATQSHLNGLSQRLRDEGLNIAAAIEQGTYVPLDVDDTLLTFMVNDRPDPVRFFGVVGALITAAAGATLGKQSRVAICGETASILWAQGNADGAIQVEQFCNQLTKQYEMDILCGFSLSSFYREEDMQVFQRICDEY
jgi:DNA-binding NarL/FixJ family response regulator